VNTPESTDSTGRGTDPYPRDPYEPPFAPHAQDPGLYDSGSYNSGLYNTGATDLLDFPPLPPYPDDPYPGTDPESAAFPEPGEAFAEPGPAPDPDAAAQPSGLRISSDAEATARLLIKLPSAPPQPSTTLRPHAAWEDRAADTELPDGIPGPRRGAAPATPFAQVAASPARPSALPSELAALTTATLVVPLPRDSRPTPALLTTTLPPDMAAQQNAAQLADAFHDTLEQVFGIDLDSVSPAEAGLGAQPGLLAGAEEYDVSLDADLPGDWFRDETAAGLGLRADPPSGPSGATPFDGGFESEFEDVDQTPYEYVPGLVPASAFGGAYGVPTQPAAFPGFAAQDSAQHDPARHALALRYLGGIFHDSSGESSYLDPGSFAARSLRGASELALGAAPSAAPDAPTEQLARIPAQPAPHEPRHGAPAKLKTAAESPAKTSARNSAKSSARNSAKNPPKPTARPERTSRRAAAAEDEAPDAARRSTGSRLLTLAAVLAAAFALLYGLALALAGGVFGGSIPNGTVVDGVSIGGLSPAAAEQAITAGLGARAGRPVQLLIGQTPTTLDPAKAGLGLDAAATVAAAQQDRTNPLVVIPALFGMTHQVAPVTTVDVTALTRALTAVAASYNSPMVEGAITFHDGVPVVTAPRQGRGFSIDGAVVAIHGGYLRVSGPIRIPVQALDPKATPAALQDALEHLARPAVAAPIALVTGTVTTQLTPARIGDALVIDPDDTGRMVATVDGTRLRSYLGANALAQEQPAVNAGFTVTDGKPVLVPARDGRGFAPDALAQAVLGALAQPSPRTATVPVGPLPAAFTTADAQALGVTDVLGTSTLPVASAPNRFANVQRVTTLVAGGIVQPGATWSFLKTVGAPSAANGFAVTAAAQHAGVDPSGGMDTVATAVFGAAFASGMGDTVHHPHASYIDRYPVGLDAAVVAPGTDLQWTNTGRHPVYVYASYANDALTIALLGEKSYDQVKIQVSQRTSVVQPSGHNGSACSQGAVPGFQVDVTRTLLEAGSQVGAEQYHVTYVPQSGQGCSGSGGSSSSAGPATGGGTSSGSGSTGSSGSGGNHSAPSAAPSPSPTGIRGGLLH
jgi:vancomycin resistance protein YoaR